MTDTKILDTNLPDWCPGCGNFGTWSALKQAIVELRLKPHETVLVSGIGCSGKHPHFIRTHGFHSIHGRSLPVATGIKLSNHKLNVIAIGGDGDGYAIGLCHTLHAMRRNLDIAYLVCNNQVYGLTKGQASPTSGKGFVSPSTPFGALEEPVNPLTLALSANATFVARAFAGDIMHLKSVIKEAVRHKGFALVDILQPCVTFNKLNTYDYFKERVYKLKKAFKTRELAFRAALEWNRRIPVGIFFREKKPTYEAQCPAIKKKPLVAHDISKIDLAKELGRYY